MPGVALARHLTGRRTVGPGASNARAAELWRELREAGDAYLCTGAGRRRPRPEALVDRDAVGCEDEALDRLEHLLTLRAFPEEFGPEVRAAVADLTAALRDRGVLDAAEAEGILAANG